jgi:hypothetical protein
MHLIGGNLHVWRRFARHLTGAFMLTWLLAGCGGEAGSDRPPLDDPEPPPTYSWDPADFNHVYEVGPGREYVDPTEVPWESLNPSTLVRIHWRSEPYLSKWVLNTTATADEPLVVLGVASAGRRPIISGKDAVTRQQLSYWNENRAVIKVGGSNLPTDQEVPSHIFIQRLDIRSARPPFTFTDDSGQAASYIENAAAIHVEIGAHITIHDCLLHDAANGLFASAQTTDLRVSGNHIYDNGMENSIYQHNSYTECLGIVFEYNHYGPLRAGCLGNNLKDRSAGTVVRYNWIEAGNRQLDLVETDHDHIANDPGYDVTFVYGNLLIEPDGAGNSQIIHYGGDGGETARYRQGILYFYHNSVVSTRDGNTTLVRCSTNDVQVDLRNNILMNTAEGFRFAITSGRGQIGLIDNWLPTGWSATHESVLEGTITNLGNLEGDLPGFVDLGTQDFRPDPTSTCLNAAGSAAPGTVAHPVNQQYLRHQTTAARPVDGSLDVGALEGELE